MSGRLALSFPWLLLVLVAGWIVIDQVRPREATVLHAGPAAAAVPAPAPAADDGPVAVDPVCGMQVRKAASLSVDVAGHTTWFCAEGCRDAFAGDPASFAAAPRDPSSHTMQGIPSWMYQAGVGILLVLSFGLFELLSLLRAKRPPESPAPEDARWNLTAGPRTLALLRWPPLRFVFQAFFVAAFLVIVGAGLFGNQNPAMNIAPIVTWTIWWAGLIFVVLYLGKAWCYVCPWDALATWAERLRFWGPRKSGLGLGGPWPRALRNIWLAVGLFVLLTWVELGMGITLVPRATAWIALGMVAMAAASAFLFDRKAFCRYGCLVGRVSGLYSLFSSTEMRVADPAVCAGCRTMDCYRGNGKGDGCPTFEFPRTMTRSTYCTLCTQCLSTCPHGNVALRLRPWGADLARPGKARADEAFLAVILLSMTAFHGLTMTPAWSEWSAAFQRFSGLPSWGSFAVLMATVLVAPVALFWALSWTASLAAGRRTAGEMFLHYAYTLLPIALFYHLAHNAEHFLMEGPKVVAMASDPMGLGWNLFGTAGWKVPPLVTLEGLWWIQVLFVLVGHVYGLWIAERTTRVLVPGRGRAFLAQLPMLVAMVLFSFFSLWLLLQPMEMRISAM